MSVIATEEQFVEELRDLYFAEQQLVEALPKMVEEATHPTVKVALIVQLEAAVAKVERLTEAFALRGFGKLAEPPAAVSRVIDEPNGLCWRSATGAGESARHNSVETRRRADRD